MRGKLPFLITAAAATLAATVLPAAGATAGPTVSTAPAATAAAGAGMQRRQHGAGRQRLAG